MRIRRTAVLAAIAAGFLALPVPPATAQYYPYPPCSPFPLAWPFCVAGAVVGLAAAIVTAPIRAFAGPPPPWAYYGPPPFYPPPYPPRAAPPGYPAAPTTTPR